MNTARHEPAPSNTDSTICEHPDCTWESEPYGNGTRWADWPGHEVTPRQAAAALRANGYTDLGRYVEAEIDAAEAIHDAPEAQP